MLTLAYRRGRGITWPEFFLLLIAIVIVYPDVIAERVAGVFGNVADTFHIFVVEVLGLAGMTAFTVWLVPRYPKFEWWVPIAGWLRCSGFG